MLSRKIIYFNIKQGCYRQKYFVLLYNFGGINLVRNAPCKCFHLIIYSHTKYDAILNIELKLNYSDIELMSL